MGTVETMYDDGNVPAGSGDAVAGDGIYSYLATIPVGTAMGDYKITITATDGASNEGTGIFTLSVSTPGVTIVDNPEADFGTCTWTCWSDADAFTGDGKACYHAPNEGCTATWTPDLPDAGNYSVYAWWPAHPNQAGNAKFTVYYETGDSGPIEVNQKGNGKQWNYLGNFSFAAGTSGYVVLSDAADGYVIADAVKFELGDPPPWDGIEDNPDFECTWTCWPDGNAQGSQACYIAPGDGSCTATWRPDIPTAGTYKVHAWWPAYPNQASNAKFTVYYETGNSGPMEKNQKTDGAQWNILGTYPFAVGDTGYVVLTDQADGYVIADAIWFELQ
jgi:hypothetical protein